MRALARAAIGVGFAVLAWGMALSNEAAAQVRGCPYLTGTGLIGGEAAVAVQRGLDAIYTDGDAMRLFMGYFANAAREPLFGALINSQGVPVELVQNPGRPRPSEARIDASAPLNDPAVAKRTWDALLTDGFIGPKTRIALNGFCNEFPVAGTAPGDAGITDAFNGSLAHFNGIDSGNAVAAGFGGGTVSVLPWRNVVASAAFRSFLDAGRQTDGRNLRLLRLAGPPAVVVQLLDEQARGAAATQSPAACTVASQAIGRFTGGNLTAVFDVLDGLLGLPVGETARDPANAAVAFCEAFPSALASGASMADAVFVALDHYRTIAGAYPNWLNTLADPAFAEWVQAAPNVPGVGEPLPTPRLLRLAGSAETVIALLREYAPPVIPAPTPVLGACGPPMGWHYYELTEMDMTALGERGDRSAVLAELAGSYPTVDAVLARIRELVPDIGGCSLQLAEKALADANEQIVYRLRAGALASLTIDLPNLVRDDVAAFETAATPVRQAFVNAIEQRITETLDLQVQADADRFALMAAQSVIEPAAPAAASTATGTTAAVTAGTTSAPATATVAGGTASSDAPATSRSPSDPVPLAQAATAAGTDQAAADGSAASATGDSDAATASDGQAPPTGSKLVDRAIARLASPGGDQPAAGSVQLTEADLRILAAEGVPAPAIEALKKLTEPGQRFASLEDFQADATTELRLALAADTFYQPSTYMDVIDAQIVPEGSVVVSDALIAALGGLPVFKTVSPTVIERIAPLQNVAFPEERLLRAALVQPANNVLPSLDPGVMDILVERARKAPPPITRPPGPVATPGCGCSRLEGENRTVYAFYPYWTDQFRDQEVSPTLDLGLISHLAYFGVRIWGEGVNVDANHWTKDGGAGSFVATARRHDVQADLAVYLSDWEDWDADKLNQAASAIAEAARRELDFGTDLATIFSLRAFDRLLSRKIGGVTVYFDDFAEVWSSKGAATPAQMRRLVESVYRRLPPGLELNIAFEMPENVAGERDSAAIQAAISLIYFELRPILGVGDSSSVGGDNRVEEPQPEENSRGSAGVIPDARVDRVIVFLDRPTRTSKRDLQDGIKRAFFGAERQRAFRKTVAIITPNGHEDVFHLVPRRVGASLEPQMRPTPFSQFDDDLVFFKDNFQGVGFWPSPLSNQASIDKILLELGDRFGPDLAAESFPQISILVANVCTVICPNRVLFRILLGAIALTLLAVVLYTRFYCKFCMEIAEKYFVSQGLVIVLFLATALLTPCDPLLRDWGAWLLGGFAFLIVLYFVIASVVRAQHAEEA